MDWIDSPNWRFFVFCLDIVLVSFLVYKTLVLLRGTRALPMLAGLGVIVVVYLVSKEIGLVTLSWILGNFLGSLILVVVVLFQDDLRRALIQVGLVSGLRSEVPLALENTIDEVARAAGELSLKRLGALIVLKRDVGLDDFTEHAVVIDAAVSHQLLESIFLTRSPIHDGAVIIEGERIVSAGAVLPLSFEPLISSSYGTRHRAALGLSELCDAVVVVVSEETGGISVVIDGQIRQGLDEAGLKTSLITEMASLSQRKGFWGRIFNQAEPKKVAVELEKGAEED